MRYFIFSALAVLLLVSPSTQADLELEPIVKEGAPGDLLLEDPVVSALRGEAKFNSSTGSVHKSLSDQLPFPVSGTGEPGGLAQFKGYGRAAEDTNVQALGVPLNGPQGGGFDLTTFPQFLWQSYEFQAGPALGTLDPRGTAGSLTLYPWTACALNGCPGSARATAPMARAAVLASTMRLQQVSIAATDGRDVAAVIGNSSGDAQGPAMSISARWRPSGFEGSDRRTVTFHLLATDLDARSPGNALFSTPNAHLRKMRVIPLVQTEWPVSDAGIFKSSVFYDWSYLRYFDPSFTASPLSQDRIQQVGTENVFVQGPWRFGAAVRGVKYATIDYDDLKEAIVNLQVSRVFEPGSFVIEPVVRGVGVSRYGLLPEASLGIREQVAAFAWFVRLGMSRRIPSLTDRYYSYPGSPGYVGNPSVRAERDWTGVMGGEFKNRAVEASLQIYLQFAEDAQVKAPLDAQTETLTNRGNARIASLTPAVTLHPLGWLDLGVSTTLSASEISETGFAFPAIPRFLGLLHMGVHAPGDEASRRWEGKAVLRKAGEAIADVRGNLLPSYTELNLEAAYLPDPRWRVTGRLENALNSRIELVRGYPNVGRAFSMLASATW